MHEELSTIRKLYLSAIIELWDRGFDTCQIAKTLNDKEFAVERGLHEALGIRRKGNA
jgi:hypothetical protein